MIPNNIKKIFEESTNLEKEKVINKVMKNTGLGEMTANKYYDQWRKSYRPLSNIEAIANQFTICDFALKLKTSNAIYLLTPKQRKLLKQKQGAHEEKIVGEMLDLNLVMDHLIKCGILGE